jgi:hypothetical protein
MSGFELMNAKKAVKRFGVYCGIRYLKNKGYSLSDVYFVLFNRYPKGV